MQSSVQAASAATPRSGAEARPAHAKPRLLVVTPDAGLMLRLTAAAETAGWWVCWRPEPNFEPEAGLPWSAIAIDADFGITAFQQASATKRQVLGLVGRWDMRAVQIGAWCRAFIERPVRTSEVIEVLAALRPVKMLPPADLR